MLSFGRGGGYLPHARSCSQMNADFYNGCTGAKERLATPDALRISEPGYKRGWNAYISPGAASDEGTPTEKTAPGTNSGGMSAGHNVGEPDPVTRARYGLRQHRHRRCQIRPPLLDLTCQTLLLLCRGVSRSTRPRPRRLLCSLRPRQGMHRGPLAFLVAAISLLVLFILSEILSQLVILAV